MYSVFWITNAQKLSAKRILKNGTLIVKIFRLNKAFKITENGKIRLFSPK
jgi:hypothetical protein